VLCEIDWKSLNFNAFLGNFWKQLKRESSEIVTSRRWRKKKNFREISEKNPERSQHLEGGGKKG
jgi:hypothetical protein